MSPVLSALFCLGESFWKMLRDRQWARRQTGFFFFCLLPTYAIPIDFVFDVFSGHLTIVSEFSIIC